MAQLAGAEAADARISIERAAALIEGSEDLDTRLVVAIAAGTVVWRIGEPASLAAAKPAVTAALADAEVAGLTTRALELRTALGLIEVAAGEQATGSARLRAVRLDANERGLGLIARKAASVR